MVVKPSNKSTIFYWPYAIDKKKAHCIIQNKLYGIYKMLNEEDFLDEISKIIRKRRLNKKLSCEKLAEQSNADYSSINLIENRKQTPRAYTLYKILYALDIDLLQLVSEKEEAIVSTNENLINKISLLDEDAQQDLLKFLDSFALKKK